MRYVNIKGIITTKKELIPIWDERIKYYNSGMYGDTFKVKDEYHDYFSLNDLVLDVETKKISLGVEIDYYCSSEAYKIGQEIYYQIRSSYQEIQQSIIVDIQYKDYEIINMTGKQLLDNKYYIEGKDIQVDPDAIYSIKKWKPTYIMEDGTEINYSTQLYTKYKG